MLTEQVVLKAELAGVPLFKSGKVREVYDLNDKLLIVASDRISAFDCILPNGIPRKGKILTMISVFWFDFMKGIVANHLISADVNEFPQELQQYKDTLIDRTMLVKKTEPLPIECVVRGYLAGSGWKEYKQKQSVCGIKLPAGLKQAEKLPEPVFTPATKADTGHDENITEEKCIEIIGAEKFQELKDISINIYKKAHEYALQRGIIIADTKFEFGILEGKIILIDEILTPDSSRFWDKKEYRTGESPKNFDKQFVRDYLETLDWDKTPPAPKLSDDIAKRTSERYQQAYNLLTASC